tara:strand:- start:1585 stop:2031 length:447 start_codon:yes stop_codon:yes gene_type:complete
MANPLYGQNKADAALDANNQLKVLEFRLKVVATGETGELTDNLDTGVDMPAGFMPVFSVVKNDGSVALAAGAKTCDVGGTDLSASLASLAAGASVYTNCAAVAIPASDTNILVDGATLVASGTTTLVWKIYGYDTLSVSSENLTHVPV